MDYKHKGAPPQASQGERDLARAKGEAEFQRLHLNRYAEIGLSLSGEDDIDKLLEMIVLEAREITRADAGTLYLIDDAGTHLEFVVLQNETLGTQLGGKSGGEIRLPPVPLFVDGEENHANVSSHVALTGDIVNIPDVYTSDAFDFTGPREYDSASGYRSKSMLVIPLRDHENEITGVLQLLNAKDPLTWEITEFHDDLVVLVASLASQAAAALTRTELIQGLKNLLDAFIQSIAGAIEEKSKYTGGHIARVARLAVKIAQKINQDEDGAFKDVLFNRDEMEELRIAAWLHDIGKITIPEYVVDKSRKLETIFDRMELVRERFAYVMKAKEAEFYRNRAKVREFGGEDDLDQLTREHQAGLDALKDDLAFVERCNNACEFMDESMVERLELIATRTFERDGKTLSLITDDELVNLCVRKGTLTARERRIIESHALVTYSMLKKLPFPRKMARIPEFAGGHHEKLDGSGYPFGVRGEDMSLQTRIMAVADIFEALTASDRPYKKAMTLSQSLRILEAMKRDGHIDPQVHDLLVSSGLVEEYAAEELLPEQVDMGAAPKSGRPCLLVVQGKEGMPHEWESLLSDYGFTVVLANDADQGRYFAYKARERGEPFRMALVDQSLLLGEDSLPLAEAFVNDPRLGLDKVMLFNAHGGQDHGAILEQGFCGVLDRAAPLEIMLTDVCLAMGLADCDTAPETEALKRMRHTLDASGNAAPDTEKGRRILIVDDSVNARMLFRYYLQNSGHDSQVAENGLTALEKFAAGGFGLVFMDLGMPVMDGYAAIKTLRAWEKELGLERCCVVAMTAHVAREDSRLRTMEGHDTLLIKPVDRDTFLEVVSRYLG